MAAVLMTTLLSAAMAPSWLGRAPAALRVPAIVSRGRPASMDLPNIDGTGAFRDVQVRSRFRLFFTAAVFFISTSIPVRVDERANVFLSCARTPFAGVSLPAGRQGDRF